jgi:hypothetical protein
MGPQINPSPPPPTLSALGMNFNNKEIEYNAIAGLSGCIYVGESQIVAVEIRGNSCGFGTTGPQVQFDCYQCTQNQNIDYRLNVFWDNFTPTDHSVMNIDSGYNYNIENNDFELPNPLQNANVDHIRIGQGYGYIRNNTFLSTSGRNSGRYDINVANTSAYSHLVVDGNHSAGNELFFFHDPPNAVAPSLGGFQGFLYYGHNEDKGKWPSDTSVEPVVHQFTGSGNGANYTTTSTTFVPLDRSRPPSEGTPRFLYDFWMPAGYIALITGSVDAYNNTAGQGACIALVDGVTGRILNQKVQAATSATGSEVSVQYIIPGDSNHHQVQLEFASCGGSGTTSVANSNTSNRPVMTVQLMPANGGTN